MAQGEQADDLEELTSVDIDQLVKVDVAESTATIHPGTLTATTADSLSLIALSHVNRHRPENPGRTRIQSIGAASCGFGSEFADWSPWFAKFAWARKVEVSAELCSPLRVYRGFPGAREPARYTETFANPSGSIAQADVVLNKRNHFSRVADYRSEAAAVGVSATESY